MRNEHSYVYLMTNARNTVIYTGVTNDFAKRVFEHRGKLIPGFTQRYNVTKLVYYEQFDSIAVAIEREKQIKGKERSFGPLRGPQDDVSKSLDDVPKSLEGARA